MFLKTRLKHLLQLVVVLAYALLSYGCAHRFMPVSVGMTTDQMQTAAGEPVVKWPGKYGVEFWKYELRDTEEKKGGRYYMLIKDGQLLAIRRNNLEFKDMMRGLPETAVIEALGRPRSTSENEHGKYLEYIVKGERHREWKYVRIVGGFVESYGTGKH